MHGRDTGRRAGIRAGRQHGPVIGPPARRHLEREGWRTSIEFCEQHHRSLSGQLLRIDEIWTAQAERFDGSVARAVAQGHDPDAAWDALAERVRVGDITERTAVRVAAVDRCVGSGLPGGTDMAHRGRP